MNLILIIYKMTENKMTKIKSELKLYDHVNFINFIVLFLFVNFLTILWKLILSKNSVFFSKSTQTTQTS